MAKSESTKIEFGYFHDYESEQFAFYRIPKVLFTDEYFRNLSSDAKVLYGLMLDRMALSIRHQWFDEEGKVYIIFTVEQVIQYMNCGRDKAMKTLAELDTKKGIGLIERVKQGFGKPDIIYVKNFILRTSKDVKNNDESEESIQQNREVEEVDLSESEKSTYRGRKNRLQGVGKTDFKRSENTTYRGRKIRTTEVGKTDPNNTNYNYTDISNTDRSNTDLINLSDSSEQQSMDLMEEMELFQMNTALVKRNIEYDCLVQRCRLGEQQQLDEIVALIVETISIERENITISGVKYPYQFVKSRLLLLEESHIEYVLDCLHENTREVKNMKDMEINEKIRYFRKQRGLSQELLAERTGINVNTIRKYEIGIRKPKVEQLKKIADGLEISVIEFLDIEIENEADLIAMLKKISPFFKWDGLLHVLVGEKFL